MSSRLSAAIPLDVYGLIIDNLAEDDDEELTSVRASSLVSRGFLPLARKHIFASIEINNPCAAKDRPSPTIEAFVHLIERNPEIGEYVRKFFYCIATYDHIMLRTLRKLTKLKCLTIWDQTENKHRWRTQKWPLRPVLLHLMQLPTLRLSYLNLHRINNFPASDFIHSSGLKHLVIQHVDFTEGSAVSPSTTPLPRKSVYLREYTAGRQSTAATRKLLEAKRPDGLPILDFTELVKVTAKCGDQEDVDAIQNLLLQTKLLCEIDLEVSESITFAGLSEMVIPSIRTLKVLTLASSIDHDDADPLSGLCDELAKISATGRNVIESISINVFVLTDADCKRGDEWGLLEKVLTKKDSWLELKEVSLKIQVYTYCRFLDDDIMKALDKLQETQFKALLASEIFNFTFELVEEVIDWD